LSAPQAPTAQRLPELDPIEISTGMVLGPRRTPPEETDAGPAAGPWQTLEARLLEALERPPCLVGFSGGRDSSAILAAATKVARQEGLADPIPFTLRFGAAPRTDETEWQELVVRHLGLDEWSQLPVAEELDALGPMALEVLERHGVHWPPNIHTFQLTLKPAAGGSLLTGNGGDELFSAFPGHRLVVLRRFGTRPRREDLRYLLRATMPDWVLAQWVRRRSYVALPWLRPRAARELERRFATSAMRIPATWSDELDKYLGGRNLEVASAITTALAQEADVNLVEPFVDPRFVRAVRDDAPPQGYGSRTAPMKKYFGDLLPPRVTERSTKAVFTEVFAGEQTRRFARQWDGAGLDRELVDAEALRRTWLSEIVDVRSLVPLQAAWLASR
jgi:asparagine synthetase B (glutamine-hydrolysing)